jgi:hypothetical protein
MTGPTQLDASRYRFLNRVCIYQGNTPMQNRTLITPRLQKAEYGTILRAEIRRMSPDIDPP